MQQANACFPQSRHKNRPSVNPGQADKSCETQRGHQGDRTVWNSSEQGATGSQMADQKPGEQCTDTGAERNFHAADGKRQQDADDAAQKDRKAKHNKIDGGARSNNDTDFRCSFLHQGVWTDKL